MAEPSSAAVVDESTWRCEDAPTACTSNGEPPPESALDSCALGAAGRAAAEVAAGCCTVPVGDTPGIDVGFGSVTIAREDEATDDSVDRACELDDEVVDAVALVNVVANEYAGGAEFVAGLDVAVQVVCAWDLEVMVTTSTPGHREAMPMPNWKTPMMLVSPTSTFAHTLWISAPMSTSPCTHAELQRLGGEKSLATQPLMVVVYAARH
jgi:hypothetical protein